jgi:tetratricopeptide (TPR) repeat protein
LPTTFYLAPFAMIVIAWAVFHYRKRSPLLVFTALFFLVSIVLILQFMPFSKQLVADRYTYLGIIALFLLLITAICRLYQQYASLRMPIIIIMTSYFIYLSLTTFSRTQVWKDSISLWNDVLIKYPDYSLALHQRGLAKYQQKDYHGAVADYTRALAVNPGYISALNNRAIAHIYLKNDTSALGDLNQIIALEPQPEYLKNRALLKKRMGDYKGALQDYTSAIALSPSDHEAHRERGKIRARLRYYQGAIADYKYILRHSPDDGYAIYHLGILLYTTHQYSEAIVMLRRSIAINYAMVPAAWYYIGLSHLALNQQHMASEAFRQSHKLGYMKAEEALETYFKN